MNVREIQWRGEGILREGTAERKVELRLERDWLGIDTATTNPVWWPLREVRIAGEGERWRVERHGQSPSGITVFVDGSELPVLLRNWRPATPVETGAEGKAWQWLAALLLILAGLGFFTWKVALPWVGVSLASTVPPEWEANLGRQVSLSMAPPAIRSKDAAATELLKRMSTDLEAHLERGREYTYEVALARAPEVNAFAAPGGSIVVYCGLVETMDSPDLLAAVVAHEMQHVALRHSTRSIFRSFALEAVIALMLGDVSGGLAEAAGHLGQLKYMREDEEEADREGLLLLARAGFDPGAMTSMLRRLEAAGTSGSEALTWLSSHPAPAQRIRRLESLPLPPATGDSPRFTTSDWTAFQRACAP